MLRRGLPALVALLACCHSPPARVPLAPRSRPPYSAAQLASVATIDEVALAPDGRELAFTSDRSGAVELWTLALDAAGTPSGAPRQRTDAKEHVTGPVYSPDGSLLVFEMDHGGDERTDLWTLKRGAEPPARLMATPAAEHSVSFAPDGGRIAYSSDDAAHPFLFNIHSMDLATHESKRLTHESINVLNPHWSPDGKMIVAVRTGDDQHGDAAVIDVESGAVRWMAPPRSDGIFVPIGFSHGLVGVATSAEGFMRLDRVPPGSSRASPVSGIWDIEKAKVAQDGTIFSSTNVHGSSSMDWMPGEPFASPRDCVVDDLALSRDGRHAAVVLETSNQPAEIRSLDRNGTMTVIVAAASGTVDSSRLARAERREAKSFDEHPIDSFVWRPPVARLGAPAPAIALVHGGPNGQSRPYFSAAHQTLAEAGFVVVSPNYRGSSGYGRAFEDLNNHDWGGGDLRDVIAAVDELVARGEVDPDRVGIMGGSYGGYLTLRAITAAPDRFRAAVEMYGMADLEEDYRLTAGRFGSWYRTEMGDPEHNRELFHERSPIHFLDRVRAPLLVMQGENDTNVPRAESDRVVAALRGRGLPVEYVVYPDEGHEFSHRDHRIDSIGRAAAFFVKHLGARR